MALDVLKPLKQMKISQKSKHSCLKTNDRSLVSLKICLEYVCCLIQQIGIQQILTQIWQYKSLGKNSWLVTCLITVKSDK